MIPYIIGGVALAATGYGVKKYLEEEVKEDSSILEEYKNIKLSLCQTNC